jgi:hypothetical protein
MVMHFNHSPAVIDSITVLSEGWELKESFTDRIIQGDTSISLSVLRRKYVLNSGVFVLNSRNVEPDTLVFPLAAHVYLPRLLPEPDTIYVDLRTNDAKTIALTVKNPGYGIFHLRPAEYVPSNGWTVEPIDTTQDILVSATAQVFLHFAAQTVEGEYPITLTLRPDVCDTSMTKTVIARVGNAAVGHDHQTFELSVWPQPSIDHLFIDCTVASRYELFDLLGASVLRGTAESGPNRIDLSGLRSGRYVVRINAGNVVRSQSISIVK